MPAPQHLLGSGQWRPLPWITIAATRKDNTSAGGSGDTEPAVGAAGDPNTSVAAPNDRAGAITDRVDQLRARLATSTPDGAAQADLLAAAYREHTPSTPPRTAHSARFRSGEPRNAALTSTPAPRNSGNRPQSQHRSPPLARVLAAPCSSEKMSRTRSGSRSCSSTACCGPRSCRRHRSGSCGCGPATGQLMGDRTRDTVRLELMLEDASIKLSSVASSLTTVSARSMLAAMIAGEHDPVVLAEMAKGRMRTKIPRLIEALAGHFEADHARLAGSLLHRLDHVNQALAELDETIADACRPWQHQDPSDRRTGAHRGDTRATVVPRWHTHRATPPSRLRPPHRPRNERSGLAASWPSLWPDRRAG